MKIDDFSELYDLISRGTENILSRNKSIKLRKDAVNKIFSNNILKKYAFDTRRINQETEINPRRGLQNYHRSEPFISENMIQKLKSFTKLKNVLGEIKKDYGREPEWQDSSARILLATIEKGLRSDYKDGDFSDSQPGVGNLDYIEQLLHVRYRLNPDDLNSLAEKDLEKIILAKDEELCNKDIIRELKGNNIKSNVPIVKNNESEISRRDIVNHSYNDLIDKLFGGVKATVDGKNVERSVTITIRDTILDEK